MPSLESIRFAQEEETRAAGSPLGVARAAFRRVEAVADDRACCTPRACEAGCAFCCHLLVEVGEAEVAALAECLGDRLEGLRSRIEEGARRARGLSAAEYRLARIRCALLGDDDRCVAYAARPLACRAHNSSCRATCERVFSGELPTDAVPMDTWIVQAVRAVRAGMGEGPGSGLELHAALLRLLG